jgi:hypothetical protein
MGHWIRIRIQIGNPDPGKPKLFQKINVKISCLKSSLLGWRFSLLGVKEDSYDGFDVKIFFAIKKPCGLKSRSESDLNSETAWILNSAVTGTNCGAF